MLGLIYIVELKNILKLFFECWDNFLVIGFEEDE